MRVRGSKLTSARTRHVLSPPLRPRRDPQESKAYVTHRCFLFVFFIAPLAKRCYSFNPRFLSRPRRRQRSSAAQRIKSSISLFVCSAAPHDRQTPRDTTFVYSFPSELRRGLFISVFPLSQLVLKFLVLKLQVPFPTPSLFSSSFSPVQLSSTSATTGPLAPLDLVPLRAARCARNAAFKSNGLLFIQGFQT